MATTTSLPLPDPGGARSLDELVERLRLLKVWAGDPSYEVIKDRVNAAWTAAGRAACELTKKTTVVDCFRLGRRRINSDLLIAVVRALHPDDGYVTQWQQALRVIGGETTAAVQVRAHDTLPPDDCGFTGRVDELRQILRQRPAGDGTAVISTIEGMAGAGKTRLAIRAGHLLAAELHVDRVLFVNLRGFHPDPAQPPVDPAAVLDAFLRLLGVPGQQVPHDTARRIAMYRDRLAGLRALVVLDDAADEAQVRPLLAHGTGCITLVTSRRRLTGLNPQARVAVDVFTAEEAAEFLGRAVAGAPVGEDPAAPARIAARCGFLPLALELVAGHVRTKPGWTLTDHADWLDERHHANKLDTGVELALALSYQHLPPPLARCLRLLALHPGPDLDAYAAAALTGDGLDAARDHLRRLHAEHLLRENSTGRYTFHDLVRGYAAQRAVDEERPPHRRAAVDQLLGYYLHTATVAARHQAGFTPAAGGPAVTGEPPAHSPALTGRPQSTSWLHAELANLVAATAYAARHEHSAATGIPAALHDYLRNEGPWDLAVRLHHTALAAARRTADRCAQAHALVNLAHMQYLSNDYPATAVSAEQACAVYQQTGDPIGHANALQILAKVQYLMCDYRAAAATVGQSRVLYQQAGDRLGQANAAHLSGLVQHATGHHPAALASVEGAESMYRQIRNTQGQANALNTLARVHVAAGDHAAAAGTAEQAHRLFEAAGSWLGQAKALATRAQVHHATGDVEAAAATAQQARDIFRRIADRHGLATTEQTLGLVSASAGDPRAGVQRLERALDLFRQVRDPDGEAETLNHLGQLLLETGDHTAAYRQFTAALAIARRIGTPQHEARALEGVGRCHLDQGHHDEGVQHLRGALAICRRIQSPHATRVEAALRHEAGEP